MRRRGRLVAGIASISVGLIAAIAGAALLATFGTDGAYVARSRLVTDTAAFTFDALSVGGVPIDGVTLEVVVETGRDAFVGVGPADEVAAFLDGVALERIVRISPDGPFSVEEVPGGGAAAAPADEPWWVAEGTGAPATARWVVAPGSWALVVMNADAAEGIDVRVEARLTVPGSGPAGVALALVGVALLVTGGALTISASRTA